MRTYRNLLLALTSLFLISSSIPGVGLADDEIVLRYEWKFKESTHSTIHWSWNFNITLERLNAYKDFDAGKRRNYGYMITTNDMTLKEAAGEFDNASKKKGYDGYTEVSFVLSFVQSLEYTSDKVTTGYDEYPRFPLETLADKGGDCEDTSILFATLILLLNYDAVLFLIPGTPDDPGHMAVGVAGSALSGTHIVHEGTSYYYAETTGEEWAIGDIPDEYGDSEIIVIEFTGKQYDPDAKDELDGFFTYLVDKYPGLIMLFCILLFLILGLLLRATMKASAAKSKKKGRSGEVDTDAWAGSYPRENSIEGGFFDPSPERRNLPDRSGWRTPSCPTCGSELVYDRGSRRWMCFRCDIFSAGPMEHHYPGGSGARFPRVDEWDR